MMLAALWTGRSKPEMETLFTPIVEELQTLHDNGFQWVRNGQIVIAKVIVLLFSVDSVARSPLQNIKQFNGEYGCAFCLHPGRVVSRGQGTARVYVESCPKPVERTYAQMLEYAEKAFNENRCVFGVKSSSILSLIPGFDIVHGFFPDYMHSVLLVVVRQFVYLWFDSHSNSKPYYLRRNLSQIDVLLLAIKPPSEIKRLPRSLLSRKYWKASEFRYFLLFYSIPCLQQFLPKEFMNHWQLLIFAVYRLMEKPVDVHVVTMCNLALHKFVVLIEELYGEEHVSYNVHLLAHLASAVERWGPLWANSAFLFEDANGKLLKFFHSSSGVSKQIFRSFVGAAYVRRLTTRYINNCSLTMLDKISSMTQYCKTAVRVTDTIVSLGHPTKRLLTPAENIAACDLLTSAHIVTLDFLDCKRVISNGKMLHTESYSGSVRTSDCCFVVQNMQDAFVLKSCGTLSICLGNDCSSHSVERVFVLFAYAIGSSTSLRAYDKDIGINLLDHCRKGIIERNRLVAFKGNSFSNKLFMCSSSDSHQTVIIKMPMFELD